MLGKPRRAGGSGRGVHTDEVKNRQLGGQRGQQIFEQNKYFGWAEAEEA